jgi:hypothetical protein
MDVPGYIQELIPDDIRRVRVATTELAVSIIKNITNNISVIEKKIRSLDTDFKGTGEVPVASYTISTVFNSVNVLKFNCGINFAVKYCPVKHLSHLMDFASSFLYPQDSLRIEKYVCETILKKPCFLLVKSYRIDNRETIDLGSKEFKQMIKIARECLLIELALFKGYAIDGNII